MKRVILLLLISSAMLMTHARTKISLHIGEKSMTATLADTQAAEHLVQLLEAGPVTVEMSDYGGFEKVGSLPQRLPATDTQLTARAGDIMLYRGQDIVIFYGSNTWSYTRLGHIDDADAAGIRAFLGTGNIRLTISTASDGVTDAVGDAEPAGKIYDLQGRIVTQRPLPAGTYVINGHVIKTPGGIEP